MTTYGTSDMDSVPMPSDLELATNHRRFTFNQFATARDIASDRERFREWLAQGRSRAILKISAETTLSRRTWEFIYTAFCQADDARDLADTQADALR